MAESSGAQSSLPPLQAGVSSCGLPSGCPSPSNHRLKIRPPCTCPQDTVLGPLLASGWHLPHTPTPPTVLSQATRLTSCESNCPDQPTGEEALLRECSVFEPSPALRPRPLPDLLRLCEDACPWPSPACDHSLPSTSQLALFPVMLSQAFGVSILADVKIRNLEGGGESESPAPLRLLSSLTSSKSSLNE